MSLVGLHLLCVSLPPGAKVVEETEFEITTVAEDRRKIDDDPMFNLMTGDMMGTGMLGGIDIDVTTPF